MRLIDRLIKKVRSWWGLEEKEKESVASWPKIGLFAALFDRNGRLLVKRRPEGISLAGEYDLPGGRLELKNNAAAFDERVVREELAREVEEEVGLTIFAPIMPAMYPAVLKGGTDWAFVVIVGWEGEPQGNYRWVSPQELGRLAEEPPGNRLVSGWGKRMCRLCLKAMAVGSPNEHYRGQAAEMLVDVLQEMTKA